MFRSIKSAWPAAAKALTHQGKQRPMSLIKPRLLRQTNQPFRTLTTLNETIALDPTQPIEPKPEFDQSVWTDYLKRVEGSDPTLSSKDFETVLKATVYHSGLEPKQIISRLKMILDHLHSHKDTLESGGFKPVFVKGCNMLMHAFIQANDLRSAKLIFKGMIKSGNEPSEVSVNIILNGIQKQGDSQDVHEINNLLVEAGCFPQTATVYMRFISAFKEFGDLRACKFFYSQMKNKNLELTVSTYSLMMEVFYTKKEYSAVLDLFRDLEDAGLKPSLSAYFHLLASVIQDKKQPELAQTYFQQLRESGLPIRATFYLLMDWDPIETLAEMKRVGSDISTRDYNNCLLSYVKKNQFPKALEVFKMMHKDGTEVDEFSYGILIDALAKDMDSSPDSAFDLYDEMKERGLRPDVVVFTSLISACSRSQDFERALLVLKEMEEQEVMPNLYTFNSLLSVMATLNKPSADDLERASLVWTKMTSMNVHPNTRTFNIYLSIISKLIKPMTEPSHLEEMRHLSLWETELADTDGKLPRNVRELLGMYRYMNRNKNHKMRPDFLTYSIVINSLCTAGQLRSAMQVYGDAKIRKVDLSVSVYNELLSALQYGGKASEAMNVWHDMKLQKVLPDDVTYEIILDVCEQLGLVETIKTIRAKRQADFDRLLTIQQKREARMLNSKAR